MILRKVYYCVDSSSITYFRKVQLGHDAYCMSRNPILNKIWKYIYDSEFMNSIQANKNTASKSRPSVCTFAIALKCKITVKNSIELRSG